ncbi:MAG: hypothetical protein ACO1PI_09655 [Bacteroidota bacterium]
MSTAIKLNLINRSNDQNNSEIVIFSKNASTDFEETAIAWTVVKYLGQGAHHPFTYPMESAVSAADSYGNYLPQLTANAGEAFHVIRDTSGDVISRLGAATSPQEIQVRNDLPQGAIDALIYKDGKLFTQKTGVAPGQMAVFEFKPTIWIGVVSEVEQGEVMNSAILNTVNTELSLLGIASADIVMTGGGPGRSATPFVFSLENVVMA